MQGGTVGSETTNLWTGELSKKAVEEEKKNELWGRLEPKMEESAILMRGQGHYGKAEFFEGDEQEGEVEDEQDEAEAQMAAMMGFGGFNTTKKKNVQQNVEGGANVHKERTWRQYMNRRGGFNRPLDKVKD
ncbi:hypothetical protein L198_04434 [Cryptococcus wingfieldii CBS 7118]|uniref:U4/U6.U5 small nuclear ribonucleoprotein 27kDa protein domain-containing protein n=1 Tax=Cryptococcus wingfieldii CBS 7118 TaxID=1295528 RepID=A0A1E3J6T8_9TREE|nr:hypothetical protein L198_04434 [Cryptococcus wingfieldii CBS 7118]ODN95816.1 hypothetical protein L198_04434 [Cryptococcus wingfieldii CBS 7118]